MSQTVINHSKENSHESRVCSDGLNFWITLGGGQLARFSIQNIQLHYFRPSAEVVDHHKAML